MHHKRYHKRPIKSSNLNMHQLFMNDNDMMPEYQSAYRSCHSTETALLKVMSDTLTAADRAMITLLGFLDLSATFDCVDHQILIT